MALRLTTDTGGRHILETPDDMTDVEAVHDLIRRTWLAAVPSQLGVDYNAAMLETIARDIAPALGWGSTQVPEPVL